MVDVWSQAVDTVSPEEGSPQKGHKCHAMCPGISLTCATAGLTMNIQLCHARSETDADLSTYYEIFYMQIGHRQ